MTLADLVYQYVKMHKKITGNAEKYQEIFSDLYVPAPKSWKDEALKELNEYMIRGGTSGPRL